MMVISIFDDGLKIYISESVNLNRGRKTTTRKPKSPDDHVVALFMLPVHGHPIAGLIANVKLRTSDVNPRELQQTQPCQASLVLSSY